MTSNWDSVSGRARGLENAVTLHGHPRFGKQGKQAGIPCFWRFERYLEFLVALKNRVVNQVSGSVNSEWFSETD